MSSPDKKIIPVDLFDSLSRKVWAQLDRLFLDDPAPCLAVGFSGGPDSTFLLLCVQKWIAQRAGRVNALHVNHLLRRSATKEAEELSAFCAQRSIPFMQLNWQHPPIQTRIQEEARNARYALLKKACQDHGILHLLVGHHLDDQFETISMRQEKKSTSLGLSGMSACTYTPFLRIIRPLLAFSKAEILAALPPNIPFIQDPSNLNPIFQRAKIRLGKTTTSLKDQYPFFQDFRKKIEETLSQNIAEFVTLNSQGYATVHQNALRLPHKDLLFFWQHLLRCIGGRYYYPSFQKTDSFLNHIEEKKGATCAGCYVYFSRDHYFVIREWKRLTPTPLCEKSAPFLWDNRFLIAPFDSINTQGICLKPLGIKGREILKKIKFLSENQISSRISETLPSLWKENQLLEVPHLGFYTGTNSPRIRLFFRPLNAILRSLYSAL